MGKSRESNCTYCLVNGIEDFKIKIIDEDYRMVALERPYVNLFFHKGCYDKIGDYNGILEFINTNFNCIFNKK